MPTPQAAKCMARRAGVLYFLLIPLGVFGILYVPQTLFVAGDIKASMAHVVSNMAIMKGAIVSALAIELVNLAVVLQLYALLKGVHRNAARFMVLCIVIAMPIAMLNELNFLALLHLSAAQQSDSVLQQSALFIALHEDGIKIAGLFWGLWLFPMGYLFYKAPFLPTFIGVLLAIGGLGYLIESLSYFLFVSYWPLSNYTFIGELAAIGWLLGKGIDTKAYEEFVKK